MNRKLPKNGFTLIELLVVIGVLTVLLSIVLIAINPARQFSQANNTQRRSDDSAILNAVHQYAADHNGSIPTGIGATATNISSTDVDICSYLVPTYIAEMPVDPVDGSYTDCTTYDTGYTILASTGAASRVTVAAPSAELSESIAITR